MKKYLFNLLTVIALCCGLTVNAQEGNKPDWRKLHYLSEEEMHTPVRSINFVETDPPAGEPRFVAEFEPMQAVLIRYPLGIPYSVVRELAEDCTLITVVSSSYESQARSQYQSNGVNMDNCVFVNAPTDSYWVRDYGPWYIFEGREPAIVDNVYNRPRPNDDNVSGVFANYWNIPMYGMNLQHTGGNMMEDGRGHGVSDELVVQENGYNEVNVRNKMRDYLGIDPYHITIDPQGDYIAHVDCWGKYLAPDKILIAQLPQSNPQYALYEQVAQYFETTNCCWGYPYHVYRVQEPGGYTLAPYTNSLILNNKVFVPLGDIASYNEQALAVYQEAMPGYEIIGCENNDWSIGWENTDALHCRTRGVMDFDMLFVDHRDVVFGEQEWQDSIAITSKFIAYSEQNLKQDSLLIYYRIDGGEYQVAHMTATGNPDEYVGYIKGYVSLSEVDYYVFGADESGHRYQQPVFGELDPHHFTMEEHEGGSSGLLTFDVDEIVIDEEQQFAIFNATNENLAAVTVNDIVENNTSYLTIHTSVSTNPVSLPYTLQPGLSMKICAELATITKGFAETSISLFTSGGEQTITVKISGELLGLNENKLENVNIYPNPMRNILVIESNEIKNVSIFNAIGQEVMSVENRNEINVESLENGLYFVRITDNKNNSVVRKVVKR
ncbi:MAG: agmatine deiminase family protein [Bacteroidia bacterium]|nr:agmatine deiminase family protein [Bacteroidia bacterium]